MTQQEVANTINISRTTYAHYEIGRREPDYKTLGSLARFFNCTTDYLLGLSDQRRQVVAVSEEERKQAEIEKAKEKIHKLLSVAESKGKFSATDDLFLVLSKVIDSAEIEYEERINKKDK